MGNSLGSKEIKNVATVFINARQHYESLYEKGFFNRYENSQSSAGYFLTIDTLLDRLTPIAENSEENKSALKRAARGYALNRVCHFVDQIFSYIYKPLSKALAYMALFYKKKYGIEIFLSTPEGITSLIEQANNLQSFGVILYWGKTNGHISPLLFNKKDNNQGWEALLMDSLGERLTASLEREIALTQLREVLTAHNVSLFVNTQYRQADRCSCHTDSLIILRNALLDIKQREFTCNSTLENQLPEQWSHISQLQNISSSETIIIRDLYSKQSKKRDSPKDKNHFDQIYKKKITIKETFSQNGLSFTGTRESERNLYLLYKGAHIASKIGKNPSRYSPDALNRRCIGFY